VLDGVASLLDKSLVTRTNGSAAQPRFTLPETIREHGLEQLAARGEETLTRAAHVAWVVSLAEQAEGGLEGRDQVWWLKRLEVELPNLRAALGWLEHTGDAATRLRVAGALLWFWYIRGRLTAYPESSRAWRTLR
jgi:predicted ATPase